MKIGFQIENLDPARGGAETYVHRFAQALLAAGHEVHLIACGFGSTPAGVFTHHVMRRGIARWQQEFRFARAAARAARRSNLDVTVAVGRTLGADVLQPHGGTLRGSRRQNLLLLRSPALKTLKGTFDWFNPRVRTQLWIEDEQYAANPPPEVIAISRMVRRDIQEFHKVPEERLHLVYNGIDLTQFNPEACAARREEARKVLGLTPAETCFLIVAHNFKLKGVRELIEAASRLERTKPWRVVVIGRANPQPYHAMAERMGCGDRFLFPGATTDILPAYGAADVYVQPTWYDPCSLVVLEALACGRPVVTTRFNGAGELMEDGREGFVLDSPLQADLLTDAMRRLLDPALRERMGTAAHETAKQYPIERNFREMMAVFEKAAERKKESAKA